MRRTAMVLILLLCAAGCATPPEQRLRETNRSQKLGAGTLRRQLLSIMGTDLVTTYDTRHNIRAIVPNPYSTELFSAGGKEYEAIYYFVNPEPKDGAVTADELMPFVFLENKMVGKGWPFYESLKASADTAVKQKE